MFCFWICTLIACAWGGQYFRMGWSTVTPGDIKRAKLSVCEGLLSINRVKPPFFHIEFSITFLSSSALGSVGSLGWSLRGWIRSLIFQTKGTWSNYFFHVHFLTSGIQQPSLVLGVFSPQCSSQGLNSLTVLTSPSLLVIDTWPQP